MPAGLELQFQAKTDVTTYFEDAIGYGVDVSWHRTKVAGPAVVTSVSFSLECNQLCRRLVSFEYKMCTMMTI